MKALLSTVGLLFIAALSGACGSDATLASDGEGIGDVEQAFAEPNCVNALPNNDGDIPWGRNPDGTWTGQMGGSRAIAPYANPKCTAAWVAQVNKAETGLHMRVSSADNNFTDRAGCENREVDLLVYSRVNTGLIVGSWTQYFAGGSHGQWDVFGFANKCHIPYIDAPVLPATIQGVNRDVKIIATGRDPNNRTTNVYVFGEVF